MESAKNFGRRRSTEVTVSKKILHAKAKEPDRGHVLSTGTSYRLQQPGWRPVAISTELLVTKVVAQAAKVTWPRYGAAKVPAVVIQDVVVAANMTVKVAACRDHDIFGGQACSDQGKYRITDVIAQVNVCLPVSARDTETSLVSAPALVSCSLPCLPVAQG